MVKVNIVRHIYFSYCSAENALHELYMSLRKKKASIKKKDLKKKKALREKKESFERTRERERERERERKPKLFFLY